MFALTLLAALALAWTVAEHLHLDRAIRRLRPSAPPAPHHPSLSIIRPIRGLDVGAAGNVRALLDSDYPAPLEILFVFDDDRDPALPVVREVLAAAPLREGVTARVLFAGAPPHGRTGKLHAMGLGVREARGELIGFSDSDTRVDRDLVCQLVDELLAMPDAGAAFPAARADGHARTAGDVGYALMLDVWYGAPAVALAGEDSTLPFIMGQLMVFRREALDAIGGIECADGQLVDDMYLGQRLNAAGWRNLFVPRALHVVTGDMTFRDFIKLMRRWVLFSKSGLPPRLTFSGYLHGAAIWLGIVAVVGGLCLGAAWPIAVGLFALGAACASDRALYETLGGEPLPLRHAWMTVGIALLGPLVVASMRLDRHVDWRGHDYALDGESRLDHEPTPPRQAHG